MKSSVKTVTMALMILATVLACHRKPTTATSIDTVKDSSKVIIDTTKKETITRPDTTN